MIEILAEHSFLKCFIEVHEKPEDAASDEQQTLNFYESPKLIRRLNANIQLK